MKTLTKPGADSPILTALREAADNPVVVQRLERAQDRDRGPGVSRGEAPKAISTVVLHGREWMLVVTAVVQ